jgi:ABC-type nitrate/sulfonate/bicarbonate transport system permease component
VIRRIAAYWPLLVVAALWEAMARAGLVRPLFLPPLSATLAQGLALLADGEIVAPLATSLFRAFAGLGLALGVGVALGLGMARSRRLRLLADPFVALAFPAPKIAFLPIFVLWFGIEHLSKILLVAFACVFPLVIATYHEAEAVRPRLLWSARALGTGEAALARRIVLPASLPGIFAGLRVAVPVALVTDFTAEMVAGGGGVGAALMFAQRFFETPTVFVYILVMLASGLVCDGLLLALRRRVLRWHD